MAIVAYMLTWTTYGTWLQGDHRGWVKEGEIYPTNYVLEKTNRGHMRTDSVLLTKKQRFLAAQAIMAKSAKLGQKIFGLAVCDNHLHLAAENINMSIGRVVSNYKHTIRLVLQDNGFCGKLWTKGFDKRYCMEDEQIAHKVAYIRTHEKLNACVII